MWDIYRKIINYNFGRKRKSNGYIYPPGSKYRESEGHFNLRLFFQYAVVNIVPSIGKQTNKLELYNKCPHRRVKNTRLGPSQDVSYALILWYVSRIINLK